MERQSYENREFHFESDPGQECVVLRAGIGDSLDRTGRERVLRLCRSSMVGYFLYGVVTRGLNYGLATLAMIAMRQFSDLFHQEKFTDTL